MGNVCFAQAMSNASASNFSTLAGRTLAAQARPGSFSLPHFNPRSSLTFQAYQVASSSDEPEELKKTVTGHAALYVNTRYDLTYRRRATTSVLERVQLQRTHGPRQTHWTCVWRNCEPRSCSRRTEWQTVRWRTAWAWAPNTSFLGKNA